MKIHELLTESEKKGLYYYVNKRKKAGTSRPASHPKAPTAQAWKDAAKTAKKEGVAENKLGEMIPWPVVANKIGSAMKAMGWKAQRKGDDAFMFSTKGAEDESQYYMVMIDNEGDGMFSYALGTFEGGRPDIGEQGKLPTTAASVSEVLMAIRDGYGLMEDDCSVCDRPSKDCICDDKEKVEEGLDELARVLELSGLNLTPDEQFDIIEEMVESLALEHGVDAEQIWEDFESVNDTELFESAAWRRAAGKSKKGGLNAKGVASYRRENPGSKLQMAVTTKPSKLKPGSKAAKRRKSFCARMGGVKGPMKKPNGKPTRKALALRKWNC